MSEYISLPIPEEEEEVVEQLDQDKPRPRHYKVLATFEVSGCTLGWEFYSDDGNFIEPDSSSPEAFWAQVVDDADRSGQSISDYVIENFLQDEEGQLTSFDMKFE